MGKGRPRHNNENQKMKPCNRLRHMRCSDGHIYCDCYDGTYLRNDGTVGYILEMADPWCKPSECKCNPYNCESTRAKWYASLSDDKKKRIESGKASVRSSEIRRKKQKH